MYTPEIYKNNNPDEILQFVKENGFGILITQMNGIPFATNIPMILEKTEEGKLILTGHLSKENPQAETFIDGIDALAVFNGAHAYISSSWYNHENVSTWNYISAQAAGKLYRMNELEVIESLIQLTRKYESGEEKPKYFEDIEERVLRENLSGVAGFRIHVDTLQSSYKLSQNRGQQDHHSIVSQLEKRGDPHSKAVAEEMKKHGHE